MDPPMGAGWTPRGVGARAPVSGTCCRNPQRPTRLRISARRDGNTERIVASGIIGLWGQDRTIWVDGRRIRRRSLRTRGWDSHGRWGQHARVRRRTSSRDRCRNGVPQSDLVTTTERFGTATC
jgi:hypothetical protein